MDSACVSLFAPSRHDDFLLNNLPTSIASVSLRKIKSRGHGKWSIPSIRLAVIAGGKYLAFGKKWGNLSALPSHLYLQNFWFLSSPRFCPISLWIIMSVSITNNSSRSSQVIEWDLIIRWGSEAESCSCKAPGKSETNFQLSSGESGQLKI